MYHCYRGTILLSAMPPLSTKCWWFVFFLTLSIVSFVTIFFFSLTVLVYEVCHYLSFWVVTIWVLKFCHPWSFFSHNFLLLWEFFLLNKFVCEKNCLKKTILWKKFTGEIFNFGISYLIFFFLIEGKLPASDYRDRGERTWILVSNTDLDLQSPIHTHSQSK